MLTIVSTQRDFQRILRQIRPSNEINNIIVPTIFDRCWFKNYRLKIVEQQAATHNDFDEQTQLTTSYETLLVCSSRGPFTAAFTPAPIRYAANKVAFDTRVKAIVFFLHFEIAPLFQPLPLPLRCTSTLEENSITIRVSPPFACETALTCFASNDIYCLVGNEEIYSLIEKRELRKARFWKIRFRREFFPVAKYLFLFILLKGKISKFINDFYASFFSFSIGKSSWFSYIIVTIFK